MTNPALEKSKHNQLPETWSKAKALLNNVLNKAKTLGATASEAGIHFESGLSTTVRMGLVDTLEFNQDKSLQLTVYQGKRKGSVSTSDLSLDALDTCLKAALRIAEYTEEDPAAGLANPDKLAKTIPNLDLDHPWEISPEQAITFAKECEQAALNHDKRITNSEGATFSSHRQFQAYANSEGFIGAYPGTRHSLSCAVIAEDKGNMQRDYDFTVARDKEELTSFVVVGKNAAIRAMNRLNSRKINTCEASIIFASELAVSFWGSFLSAISGGHLYRKASFLVDHLDKRIFPDFIHIEEKPHLLKALGSAPFDTDGVATKAHDIVREGILKSYVLSSYSARKLKLQTTGNAGGVHNLIVSHNSLDRKALLKEMGKGLLVTELLGHGVNLVTGDYSRGAAGFWVENGEIQYPVEEITIASNLKNMFSNIRMIGNDIERRGNIFTGSVLIDHMMIAGN